MLQDSVAKAFSKEGFVADEYISSAHLARLQIADEAFGLGKSTHLSWWLGPSVGNQRIPLRCAPGMTTFDFSILQGVRLGVES